MGEGGGGGGWGDEVEFFYSNKNLLTLQPSFNGPLPVFFDLKYLQSWKWKNKEQIKNTGNLFPNNNNNDNNNNNMHFYSAFLLVIQSTLPSVNT